MIEMPPIHAPSVSRTSRMPLKGGAMRHRKVLLAIVEVGHNAEIVRPLPPAPRGRVHLSKEEHEDGIL